MKDENQLRDSRIQGVLEVVCQVQVHLEEYVTKGFLQTVDEDRDRAE